ncbi:MAG: vanadium-dependent haloperoxidase [Actinomycetota bacterium]
MTRITRTAVVLLAAVAVAGAAPVQQTLAAGGDNAVVHWNEFAVKTVLADSARATPSASALYVGIVQAAVYNAVVAIEGGYQPYRFALDAPDGASEDAAVATAAHDVLQEYFSAQEGTIDGEYSAFMSQIPDGQSKIDGTSVGAASAGAMIADRTGDGRDVNPGFTFQGGTGYWTPPPGTSGVTPYTAKVRPFLMESPDQFRPNGPLATDSPQYAAEYDEVKAFGDKNSTVRTPLQTAVAVFWSENTVGQYNRAFRTLATTRSLSVLDSARLFAMTGLTQADAMIGCWDAKYFYQHWRPFQAIHAGDADGNPRTVGDPNWTPFASTANHPEYVSGHGCLTGATAEVLKQFLGNPHIDFVITGPATTGGPPTVVHTFDKDQDLIQEVSDARVWGGDHFRTGSTDGVEIGHRLAKWALDRYFQRT